MNGNTNFGTGIISVQTLTLLMIEFLPSLINKLSSTSGVNPLHSQNESTDATEEDESDSQYISKDCLCSNESSILETDVTAHDPNLHDEFTVDKLLIVD